MNNRVLLVVALMAILPVMAEVPNPLMAPLPRGMKTSSMANPQGPQGGPLPADMSQVSLGAQKPLAPVVEAVDFQSSWYVSAIVGNSAMLRQRVASTPKNSTGTGQFAGGGQFPGLYPPGSGPQQNQNGQNGSAETKAVVGMSLMVTDGEETFVMGSPVRARVKGDIVSLMLIDGNSHFPVFYGGVEPSQNMRTERKVTEQPDSAFAGRMAPNPASGSVIASPNNDQPQPQSPFAPR